MGRTGAMANSSTIFEDQQVLFGVKLATGGSPQGLRRLLPVRLCYRDPVSHTRLGVAGSLAADRCRPWGRIARWEALLRHLIYDPLVDRRAELADHSLVEGRNVR